MKRRSASDVAVLVALAGVLGAAAVLHARDHSWPLPPATGRLLYLRSGDAAARWFLSFDVLAADVYWIRTIQHYGLDRKSTRTTDRFQLLDPLLDMTTTLDPQFNVAYRFGAIFLSMEPPNGPARADQAIRLLEKGLAHNPSRWQYAHDIGFVHYWHTGNHREAAAWFAKAAGMPGAPAWLRPLAAVTLARGGDRDGARRMLQELEGTSEGLIRLAATRGLNQLKALDDIDALEALVVKYFTERGTYPAGWSDLMSAGLLQGVPLDPTGAAYVYRSETRRMTLSPESSLAPLPDAFTRR
jgi:hypothetical protein